MKLRLVAPLLIFLVLPACAVPAASQKPPRVPVPSVLIAPGQAKNVTISDTCKRITNHAKVSIGIEVGPRSEWPLTLESGGNIEVKPCV